MPAISKALVVGGGIGGLTAGIALRQNGIEVDLVEIRNNLSVYGVGIIQPNNMLRALGRIGLAQACVDEGRAFAGWRINDADGNHLMDAPASNSADPRYPPINGVTRPVLHHILVEGANKYGVKIQLDDTLENYDEDSHGTNVRFSSGREERYDLIVACDGAYSDMRRRLFGDQFSNMFTGQGVWRYNLPILDDMQWGQFYFGSKSKVGLVPMNDRQMYMLIVTQEPGNPFFHGEHMAAFMQDRLEGYTGIVAELREMISDPAGVVYRPMEPVLVTSPWVQGRVVLIGDAAHSTTPHLAQGAAIAIEDGVLLGELMGRDASLSALLDEFMIRRYDRAKYVVETSVRIGELEMLEWSGHHCDQNPGALLHEASLKLLEDY